jgi:uncharacterized paraquat-inducible protein A
MIWIHCYDCGEQTQVPPMGKNQTKQICSACKAERSAKWAQALAAKE